MKKKHPFVNVVPVVFYKSYGIDKVNHGVVMDAIGEPLISAYIVTAGSKKNTSEIIFYV